MTNKDEIKEFNTLLAELLLTYEDRAPPVMPCYTKQEKRKLAQALSATMAACIRDSKMSAKNKKNTLRKRAEHHAQLGLNIEEFQAMFHTAIAAEKVNFIPDAKAAVGKERKKLFDLDAFDLDAMMAQDDVIAMYDEQGKPVHVGSVRFWIGYFAFV